MLFKDKLDLQLNRGYVGFPTALASSVGVIMASPVILTVTSGFGIGGDTFALAILLSFIMIQCQITTFSEAASMMPTAGSVYDYISCGMGRFWAIIGAISAYLIVHIFAGTAETVLSGIMAIVNFEGLNAALEDKNASWVVGVGIVCAFGLLNAFGIEVFGRAEIFLTFAMWVTLMTFSIVGLIIAPAVKLESFFGTGLVSDPFMVFSLVGMAMFMFVGCELVTPMAPEIKKSHKTIPYASALGLCFVALCMYLYGASLSHQVENIFLDEQTGLRLLDTPMAIPVFAKNVMGEWGPYWLGIGFLLAGGATINTLMAAVPRILYGMAVDGALPKIFGYLHPKYKTPVFSILIAVVLPCVHAFWIQGDIDKIFPLVLAAVCSWGVAYLLVTLSIVILRIRRPDYPRAYKSPFFPIPQIISSIGIVIAIVFITPPGMNASAVYVPFGIILALTALYALIWTIGVQKVNPFLPVPLEESVSKSFAVTDKKFLEINELKSID
ncbi:APC family permease [Thorsellia kenyensis]|uniref:APC family permease n=1 Tax=Thorsellia kenyensis TaxID=1549888 RepID=A0ABV6CB08_9GAMM